MHIIWEVVIMSYSDALQGLSPKINIVSGSGQETDGKRSIKLCKY